MWTGLNDEDVCAAIGESIRSQRLTHDWSQQQLAKEAGISVSTLKRIEAGGLTLAPMVRLWRALGVLDAMESVMEPATISPVQLLRMQGHQRQRASTSKKRREE